MNDIDRLDQSVIRHGDYLERLDERLQVLEVAAWREPETGTAQNPGWLCSVHNSPGEAGDCCCAHALDFGPCGDCRKYDQPITPATATESTRRPTGEIATNVEP